MADPLSVTASILAVAGFAATSCKTIFQTISQFSAARTELQHHLVTLCDLQSTFANIASLQQDVVLEPLLTPEFGSRLHACMRDLQVMEDLAKSIHAQLQENKMRRAWSRMRLSIGDQQQTMKTHLGRIESYHRAFSLDLLLLSIRLGIQIANETTKKQDNNERSIIISTTQVSNWDKNTGLCNNTVSFSSTHNSTQDDLLLSSKIWSFVQFSLLRSSICIGPLYTQSNPNEQSQTNLKRLKHKKGHGILISSELRRILPFRLDLLVSCHHSQVDRMVSFSLHFKLSFPRVVPYSSQIFDLVRDGSVEILRQELEKDQASIFDVLPSGDTLLHVAACHQSYDMILFLIQNRARIDSYNDCGDTPLHRAVSISKNYDICRLLLDHGSDLWSCNLDGQTALHTFSTLVTEKLFQSHHSEIDFAVADKNGMTLLHYLAWSSKTLPETFHKYSKNLKLGRLSDDTSHRSPLDLATMRGNLALVKYLLSQSNVTDVETNASKNGCNTLLHFAVMSKRAPAIIAELQSHAIPLKIHARDQAGCSALHLAAYHGNMAGVKALFDADIGASAELGIGDDSGRTPIQIAREARNQELVTYLDKMEPEKASRAKIRNFDVYEASPPKSQYRSRSLKDLALFYNHGRYLSISLPSMIIAILAYIIIFRYHQVQSKLSL